MDDLAKKLNDLLNSPDGMQKLQQAAASFGISLDGDAPGEGAGGEKSPPPEPVPAPPPPPSEGVDLSALGDLSAITRLLPLLSDMKGDDENTTLLKALRPYLQTERQQRLDETIKIMHLLKVLPLLGGDR